jgi:hypothetical protein
MNGLIRVTPKAIHTYVHHDRKPVCIAFAPMAKYVGCEGHEMECKCGL